MSDAQYLKFTKVFLLILTFLLIFSSGRIEHWPFVYWSLYDQGNPQIPKTASRIELRVLDADGVLHSLRSMDFYTLDDDSSVQPAGQEIINKTFFGQPQKFSIYRPFLVQHIEKNLNIKVKVIEAYKYTWNINYDVYPPLDIESPNKISKIGSFKAEDYL